MPKPMCKSDANWIAVNQSGHFCACGCGKTIRIIRQHRYARGIPKYFSKSHRTFHWIKENEGKHICQCGCGKAIPVNRNTKWNGIPGYIKYHHSETRKTHNRWIVEQRNKHICACGCGDFIKITKWTSPNNIPSYIPGHMHGYPLDLWVKEEQGKHHCACGCGGGIPIVREHRKHGIPDFIHGHNSRGANNPSWRGGITPAYVKERGQSNLLMKSWRKSVLDRDEHSCQMPWCTSHRGRHVTLHAHHIIGFMRAPRFRRSVWNGITMCEPCHFDFKGRERENEGFLFSLIGGKHPYGCAG